HTALDRGPGADRRNSLPCRACAVRAKPALDVDRRPRYPRLARHRALQPASYRRAAAEARQVLPRAEADPPSLRARAADGSGDGRADDGPDGYAVVAKEPVLARGFDVGGDLRAAWSRGALARDDDHRARLFRVASREAALHALDDPWLDHARGVRASPRSRALEGQRMSTTNEPREDLRARIDAIESGYEFLLAYAAQGRPTDKGPGAGSRVREQLDAMQQALDGLGDVVRSVAASDPHDAATIGAPFFDALDRDAL